MMRKLWNDEKGQDLIEYALLAGFAAVAASALFPNMAYQPMRQIYERVENELTRLGGG